ncbi:hypothetical protein C8J57DRAFT_1513099 [Mycena rebaudengoi]|nr:hypothetical protein C8J57DRAFT_1513099 [Mycena rebaudengoi]
MGWRWRPPLRVWIIDALGRVVRVRSEVRKVAFEARVGVCGWAWAPSIRADGRRAVSPHLPFLFFSLVLSPPSPEYASPGFALGRAEYDLGTPGDLRDDDLGNARCKHE